MNTYYLYCTDHFWCDKIDYIPYGYKFKCSSSVLPYIVSDILWEWIEDSVEEYEIGEADLFGNPSSKEELREYLESVDNLEDYLDAYDFMCGTIALAKDNEGVIEHLMRNNLKMNIKDYENNIL
jgi:hypothetical protein